MKRIAHISDLHFGTVDKRIAKRLINNLSDVNPDLLVISGDLTQRARTRQFIEAGNYLEKLPKPQLIVPGNHDIPLFDIFRRFLMPLKRYCKYITDDLSPQYLDDQLVVYGVNTARSLTWKEGRISVEQIEEMENQLCAIPNYVFKVVVTHHPFIPPPGDEGIRLVGRSIKALKIIDRCSVDLLLAGHLHQGYSGDIRPYYPKTNRSIIVVQAGTAISNRIRQEPNGYNLISVTKNRIHIEVREWDGKQFNVALQTSYAKQKNEWQRQRD